MILRRSGAGVGPGPVKQDGNRQIYEMYEWSGVCFTDGYHMIGGFDFRVGKPKTAGASGAIRGFQCVEGFHERQNSKCRLGVGLEVEEILDFAGDKRLVWRSSLGIVRMQMTL